MTVTGPPEGKGLVGVDVDMGDMPDAAMTLAVAALFAEGERQPTSFGAHQWHGINVG